MRGVADEQIGVTVDCRSESHLIVAGLLDCRSQHHVIIDDPADTERRVRTNPGDYIYVPPFAPHREENPDPVEDAVVVIARTTQQAIVVNLPSLRAGAEDAWHRSQRA